MDQILTQIRALTPAQIETLFKLTDGTSTMYTGQQVVEELDRYTDWLITVGKGRTADLGWFLGIWAHYKDTTEYNLSRIWSGMQEDYDPINNYDMLEIGADGKKNDKYKDTVTPHGGTHTESKTYRAGVNSSGDGAHYDKIESDVTPVTDDQGTNITKTETERSFDNTVSVDFDGSTKSGYHEGSEHYFKRSGNIGVKTSSETLMDEFRLRSVLNLLAEYVHTFMDQYGFCIGGV